MSDNSDTGDELHALVTALDLTQTSNYCVISVLALLVYDHLLTFAGELQFVWGRRFSGATVIFALNRYTTLIGKVILPICVLCTAPVVLVMIFTILAYFISALFSALRIYAIWDKNWMLFLLVLLLAVSVPVTNMYHYIRSAPAAAPFPFYGCGENVELTDEQFYKLSMVTHTCAIATDLLVVVLTWIKTFEIKRVAAGLQLKTSLTTLLLRDGTLYFGVLVILNAIDLAINTSNATINPMSTFIDAFTCILVSRFMLRLRSIARSSSCAADQYVTTLNLSQFTTIQIARPDAFVGDLGAPLDYTTGTGWTGTTEVVATRTAYESHGGVEDEDEDGEGMARGAVVTKKVGPLWVGLLEQDSEKAQPADDAETAEIGIQDEESGLHSAIDGMQSRREGTDIVPSPSS
ncbi:hypothetical protein C8Q80DRAFT_1265851 [Daedaleopsis nitida]|nr:hypothetical protein C8Q80DRAFT_1265851 [Daedaleopsis nitida]